MKHNVSGKLYKFSDGTEVVVYPITVGDYINLATKYLSNETDKNIHDNSAKFYVARFSYFIKEVIGQKFLNDDLKNKYIHDYVCALHRISDQRMLDDIENDTTAYIKPIKSECTSCGKIMDVYVQPSMSFEGYNRYNSEEFYEIPKNILPSKGIPYPENLQIYITPMTLSEQKLLQSCNQANYYSKLLDGIYIAGEMFDREQLLLADVQTLELFRKIYVYDTNSKIMAKSNICEHCGEYNDISFKIDDIKFENGFTEMFKDVNTDAFEANLYSEYDEEINNTDYSKIHYNPTKGRKLDL